LIPLYNFGLVLTQERSEFAELLAWAKSAPYIALAKKLIFDD